eukprot:g16236.t1
MPRDLSDLCSVAGAAGETGTLGLCSEELLRQLQAIDSKSQAEALFGGSALALPPQESAAWVEAWQKFGSERLSSWPGEDGGALFGV